MKKVFSKILGLFCAFALFFGFSGCSLVPGLSGGGGGTGGGGSGNTNNDHTNEQPVTNPEFEQDAEGNWVYFDDLINDCYGVRIVSIPPVGAESGNEVTNAERARFYTNVSAQFEVLSEYVLCYLLGEFGGGIEAVDIVSEDGDYATKIQAISPQERDVNIFDTNQYRIEGVLTGWDYDGTDLSPIYSTENNKAWILYLGQNYISDGADYYANSYIAKHKDFVQLRLMEIVLNELYNTSYKTSWADASGDVTSTINAYIKEFAKLGFEMGEMSDTDSIAGKIKQFIEQEVIGTEVISYDNGIKNFAEPGNAEQFYDINKNSEYNPSFTNEEYDTYSELTSKGFFVGYSSKVETLVHNLSDIVMGEEVDSNGNGYIDKGFIGTYAMEVRDLASKEFFNPGVPGTEGAPRKLNNMEYAQYKSAMFFPKNMTEMDSLTIYVDSETNFSMRIWLRVNLNTLMGRINFTLPLTILNLNSAEGCDWANEDMDKEWTGDEEFWTEPTELFDNRERNAVWSIDLEALLSEQYFNQIYLLGFEANEQTDYIERGYHSNSKDNADLKDLYTLLRMDENAELPQWYTDLGLEASVWDSLVSSSEDSYFEFVFEIIDEQPEQEYNFKFLIMPTFWDWSDLFS